MLEKDKFEAI
jgi:chromosome segregation ATPase